MHSERSRGAGALESRSPNPSAMRRRSTTPRSMPTSSGVSGVFPIGTAILGTVQHAGGGRLPRRWRERPTASPLTNDVIEATKLSQSNPGRRIQKVPSAQGREASVNARQRQASGVRMAICPALSKKPPPRHQMGRTAAQRDPDARGVDAAVRPLRLHRQSFFRGRRPIR